MRTLLLGTDFAYKQNGDLIPIEINTNVGQQPFNIVEAREDVYDLTDLISFINNNGFTKIEYIGGLTEFFRVLSESTDIECVHHLVNGQLTIPYIEDNETTLIIRSAFDTTAIVDEEYCVNKINFLNLIKNESFASEFAYKDSSGILINTITTILDNGIHPNFILKASFPNYVDTLYPELYRFETQEQLDNLLNNLNENYFVMPYYLNDNKLQFDHITVVRSLNILFPPNLESIQIGQYHNMCDNKIDTSPDYDSTTFKYIGERDRYLTFRYNNGIEEPKLESDDIIIMGDGTEKTVLDLQVGDIIRTIDIPNPFNANKGDEVANYRINYDELVSGTTYSTNKVISKRQINKQTRITNIQFTDSSTWMDTGNSKYLIERDGEVRFVSTDRLIENDKLILIDITDVNNLTFVEKTVSTINNSLTFFDGWVIAVEREHLFLTKSTENSSSFVTIEHNIFCSCDPNPYSPGSGCGCGGACGKGAYCAQYNYYSSHYATGACNTSGC